MSKWISASIVLLVLVASVPAQAEWFARFGGPVQAGPEVMSAPVMQAPAAVMQAPQKMGAVQTEGYPFTSGCCESKTPCCDSAWSGYSHGCNSCWTPRLHGWFARRCAPSCDMGCGSAVQKSGGPAQKGGCTSCGAPQKYVAPIQKGSYGPTCGSSVQKGGFGVYQKGGFGAYQKGCGTCGPTYVAPIQKGSCGPTCGSSVQKGGFGAFQKGCGTCGPTCCDIMPKRGPCSPCACGGGIGCRPFGLFGGLFHGCFSCGPAVGCYDMGSCGMPAGCGKGGYGTVMDYGKSGCSSCGGGMKHDFGSPIQNAVPAPAKVMEQPTIPTPSPIVPSTPDKSARRSYSWFN